MDRRYAHTNIYSVCVVSIMRIVHVHSAAERGDVSSKWPSVYRLFVHYPYTAPQNSSLITHRQYIESGTYAAIWSTVEVNVAIMCSSLLVMKPLLVRIIPSSGRSELTPTVTGDSGIRRMMSISTMEESVGDMGEAAEARCEAWAWTDRNGASDEKKDDRSA